MNRKMVEAIYPLEEGFAPAYVCNELGISYKTLLEWTVEATGELPRIIAKRGISQRAASILRETGKICEVARRLGIANKTARRYIEETLHA